jgi:hypothetical protein
MDDYVAYCGLKCNKCHAFIATQNNDIAAIKEIAQRWGQQDNQNYSIEDIRCNGCRSNVLNKHCYRCNIRSCGVEKGLQNCGKCDDFICDKLQDEWNTWHDADPEEARRTLIE